MRGEISSDSVPAEWQIVNCARAGTGAHGNPLLDQEGPDLIDRRRPPRDQSRTDPVQRLQIQLILGLLADQLQVGTQRSFGDGLGIVVVILLPLDEGASRTWPG